MPTKSPDAQDIFVRKRGTDKIIIFVHGVLGDARGTFTNGATRKFWPQLITEDADMDSYDVLSLSFDAGITSGLSLEQIATVVRTELEDRKILENYDEIYFVTHSMGGLVVKRLILDLWQARSPVLDQQISGVIFISTPAKGANVANYLELLNKLVGMRPLVDLRTYDANTYLQILENQWKDFFDHRRSEHVPRIFLAYETQATFGHVVVPQLYSETPHDARGYPVIADHLSIVKPPDRSAKIYEWVNARIKEASQAHAAVPFKEWGPGVGGWQTLSHLLNQFTSPTAQRDGMNLKISGDTATIGKLSVTGTYRAATWASLVEQISQANTCIQVTPSINRREIILSTRASSKRCSAGHNACSNVMC
jgi:pimeloyl-ACP methyl ester carboxylesterase